jgi:hypothetical protein
VSKSINFVEDVDVKVPPDVMLATVVVSEIAPGVVTFSTVTVSRPLSKDDMPVFTVSGKSDSVIDPII